MTALRSVAVAGIIALASGCAADSPGGERSTAAPPSASDASSLTEPPAPSTSPGVQSSTSAAGTDGPDSSTIGPTTPKPSAAGSSEAPDDDLPHAPGDLVFVDDFSDPSTGWFGGEDSSVDGAVTREYSDGEHLRLTVDLRSPAAETALNSSEVSSKGGDPLSDLANVSIEVEMEVVESSAEEVFVGLSCWNGTTGWYEFDLWILGDRTGVAIYEMNDGVVDELGRKKTVPGLSAQPGEVNHLRADCVGQSLSLWVNGEQVMRVHGRSRTSGPVGVNLTGYDDTPPSRIVVDLDDMTVRRVGTP